uniref:Uncharacterized protein n=1 Tax=Anguilla anguilla TaxID=7936 RepID=A0A0E9V118_ANGAN
MRRGEAVGMEGDSRPCDGKAFICTTNLTRSYSNLKRVLFQRVCAQTSGGTGSSYAGVGLNQTGYNMAHVACEGECARVSVRG